MSGSAAARYAQLSPTRLHYIQRAEKHAKVTIPSLFVERGFTAASELYTPYQSVGARGVNNLASKLLLSLFPPNSPFFKLSVDEMTMEEMTGQEGFRAEVDKALSKIEKKVVNTLETSPLRTSVFESLKQLLVAGNVLLYVGAPRDVRVFRLSNYVVKRAPDGTVIEIVIEEKLAEAALPPKIKEILQGENKLAQPSTLPSDKEKSTNEGSSEPIHNLYTYVCLDGDTYTARQEICDHVVEGSQASYPKDKCPYLALRLTKVDGEDYGRAYVEEYYGDLFTLECLMESLVSGAAVMSKIVGLVNPASHGLADDLTKAENGQFIEGKRDDVDFLQVEKSQDLSFAKAIADDIIQRLAYAFLMNTAIQRPGERVTAEEIRYMARELEDVMGGVYSLMSQEFQLPFVRQVMHQMGKSKDIPALPKQIQPMITTGLEALGRGHDLDKLDMFLKGLGEALGPQAVAQWIVIPDYITRRGTALGIDTAGMVKTQEQVTAEQQQAQLAQMSPDLIKGGATLAKTAMETQANGAEQG